MAAREIRDPMVFIILMKADDSPAWIHEMIDDRVDVQGGRVERWHTGNCLGSKQERELRSAEDQSVDPILVAELLDECDDLRTRLIAEIALEKLTDIALVHPQSIVRLW
jgi:hypothetical protein